MVLLSKTVYMYSYKNPTTISAEERIELTHLKHVKVVLMRLIA